MHYKKIESLSLSEKISKEIIRSFLIGEIKPGQKLSEKNLGELFGVSRSPVREALREIENLGIVEIIPRKGAYVSRWTIKDFLDFSELRAHIECFSVRLAAARSDAERVEDLFEIIKKLKNYRDESNLEKIIENDINFHLKIANLSKNSSLINYINSQKFRTLIYMIYSFYILNSKNDSDTEQEHLPIAEAIKSKNETLAEELMGKHVIKSHKTLYMEIRDKGIENINLDLPRVLKELNIPEFSNLNHMI